MAERVREATLMIMLTAEEKDKIRKEADRRGMTMSTYARITLLGATEPKDPHTET